MLRRLWSCFNAVYLWQMSNLKVKIRGEQTFLDMSWINNLIPEDNRFQGWKESQWSHVKQGRSRLLQSQQGTWVSPMEISSKSCAFSVPLVSYTLREVFLLWWTIPRDISKNMSFVRKWKAKLSLEVKKKAFHLFWFKSKIIIFLKKVPQIFNCMFRWNNNEWHTSTFFFLHVSQWVITKWQKKNHDFVNYISANL